MGWIGNRQRGGNKEGRKETAFKSRTAKRIHPEVDSECFQPLSNYFLIGGMKEGCFFHKEAVHYRDTHTNIWTFCIFRQSVGTRYLMYLHVTLSSV